MPKANSGIAVNAIGKMYMMIVVRSRACTAPGSAPAVMNSRKNSGSALEHNMQ